jgi:hypothetical protein
MGAQHTVAQQGKTENLNAAGGVGDVEPYFDAVEVGAFGADRGGDVRAEIAGGTDAAVELGVEFAELGDFIHGGEVDFFLGVKAGAHGPFLKNHSVTPSLTWAQSMRKVPLSLKSRP